MLHPWSRLPTELKLRVLEYALDYPAPVEVWYRRLFCGKHEMEGILRMGDLELVLLSLEVCQYSIVSCASLLHGELIQL